METDQSLESLYSRQKVQSEWNASVYYSINNMSIDDVAQFLTTCPKPLSNYQEIFLVKVASLKGYVPLLIDALQDETNFDVQEIALNSHALYQWSCSLTDPDELTSLLFQKVAISLRSRFIQRLANYSAKLKGYFIDNLYNKITETWGLEVSLPLLWSCSPALVQSQFNLISIQPRLTKAQFRKLQSLDFELTHSLSRKMDSRSYFRKHSDNICLKQKAEEDNFLDFIEKYDDGSSGSSSCRETLLSHTQQKRLLKKRFESCILKNPKRWSQYLYPNVIKSSLTPFKLYSFYKALLLETLKDNNNTTTVKIPFLDWMQLFIEDECIDILNDCFVGDWWKLIETNPKFWHSNMKFLQILPLRQRNEIALRLNQLDGGQYNLNWLEHASSETCIRRIKEFLAYQSESDARASAINCLLQNCKLYSNGDVANEYVQLVLTRYKNDPYIFFKAFEDIINVDILSDATFDLLYAMTKKYLKKLDLFDLTVIFEKHFRQFNYSHLEEIYDLLREDESHYCCYLENIPKEYRPEFLQALVSLSVPCAKVLEAVIAWIREEKEDSIDLTQYPFFKDLIFRCHKDYDGKKFRRMLDPASKIPVDWILSETTCSSDLYRTDHLLQLGACIFSTDFQTRVMHANTMTKQDALEYTRDFYFRRCRLLTESNGFLYDNSRDNSTKMWLKSRRRSSSSSEDYYHVQILLKALEAQILEPKRKCCKFQNVLLWRKYATQSDILHVIRQLIAEYVPDEDMSTIQLPTVYKPDKETGAVTAFLAEEKFSLYGWHNCTRQKFIIAAIAALSSKVIELDVSLDIIQQCLNMPDASLAFLRDALSRLILKLSPTKAQMAIQSLLNKPHLFQSSSSSNNNDDPANFFHLPGLHKHLIRLRCLGCSKDERLQLLKHSIALKDGNVRYWICRCVNKLKGVDTFEFYDQLLRTITANENRLFMALSRAGQKILPLNLKKRYSRQLFAALERIHVDESAFNEFVRHNILYIPLELFKARMSRWYKRPSDNEAKSTVLLYLQSEFDDNENDPLDTDTDDALQPFQALQMWLDSEVMQEALSAKTIERFAAFCSQLLEVHETTQYQSSKTCQVVAKILVTFQNAFDALQGSYKGILFCLMTKIVQILVACKTSEEIGKQLGHLCDQCLDTHGTVMQEAIIFALQRNLFRGNNQQQQQSWRSEVLQSFIVSATDLRRLTFLKPFEYLEKDCQHHFETLVDGTPMECLLAVISTSEEV